MLEHPMITALERDGYPDNNFCCCRCGEPAFYFADEKQLCQDCAENMLQLMTTRQIMEAMGWEVE